MTTLTSASSEQRVLAPIGHALRWLDSVPYWLLAVPLRLAVATVFWNSAMTKLANWNTAVELFVEEYKVPLLPPELAAYMAVSIELTTPVLLVLGLATRAASFVLLGMTAVIEVLVYPQAWPTHIQWAAMLFVLLCRGPGKLSLDHLVRMRFSMPTER
ncbi:MAG: DoxX family protein [Betaproteobacteria bacterium]|nr:MAG: DoxX family protein [Betaproteobacteria bacterium]